MIGKKCLLLMFMLSLYLAALTALISLSEAETEEPTIEEVNTVISEAKDLIEKVKELAPGDDGAIEKAVEDEINGLIACFRQGEAHFIVVSNEVGTGMVPADEMSRLYRDLLGKANQMLAQYADEVLMMVAGIPVRLKSDDSGK